MDGDQPGAGFSDEATATWKRVRLPEARVYGAERAKPRPWRPGKPNSGRRRLPSPLHGGNISTGVRSDLWRGRLAEEE